MSISSIADYVDVRFQSFAYTIQNFDSEIYKMTIFNSDYCIMQSRGRVIVFSTLF